MPPDYLVSFHPEKQALFSGPEKNDRENNRLETGSILNDYPEIKLRSVFTSSKKLKRHAALVRSKFQTNFSISDLFKIATKLVP